MHQRTVARAVEAIPIERAGRFGLSRIMQASVRWISSAWGVGGGGDIKAGDAFFISPEFRPLGTGTLLGLCPACGTECTQIPSPCHSIGDTTGRNFDRACISCMGMDVSVSNLTVGVMVFCSHSRGGEGHPSRNLMWRTPGSNAVRYRGNFDKRKKNGK
jgi:hypothetical protein